MKLSMPITRQLLSLAKPGSQNSLQSETSAQLDERTSSKEMANTSLPMAVGKMCDSNKYKMSVARRNERERRRVQHVNRTFDTLRQHVQGYRNANKKMSKVETLRCAVEYIRELQTILGLPEEAGDLGSAPRVPKTEVDEDVFDYENPATSLTSPSMQPDLGCHSYPISPAPSGNSSPSPMPHTPATPDYSCRTTCSLPPSPVSAPPADPDTVSCHRPTSIADSAVLKQEPLESQSVYGNFTAFDFNANAVEASQELFDDQSYQKIEAVLQLHMDTLSSLPFTHMTRYNAVRGDQVVSH